MELFILIIISIIQSVIGVGVLLFGTPIFLLIGYSFFETLVLLLPISIIISLLTIIQNRDINFDIKSLIFLVFFIILGTYFAVEKIQSISILIISITLLITFIFNLFSPHIISQNFANNKNIILSFIGLLHGITNQGGALLLWFFSNSLKNKILIRSNVAFTYGIMATFQAITLVTIDFRGTFELMKLNNVLIPIISFFLGSYLFRNIRGNEFKKVVNIFIGIFGILLFYKFIFS